MIQFTYPSGLTIVEDKGFIVKIQDGIEQTTIPQEESALIKKTHTQILEYLDGIRKEFTIPYKLAGTDFQIKVWEKIAEIPYGEMRSYRFIADAIHHPRASRAVGSACNRCVLSYLIPCQRVVSSRGIGGYGSDLSEKERLLALESRFSADSF